MREEISSSCSLASRFYRQERVGLYVYGRNGETLVMRSLDTGLASLVPPNTMSVSQRVPQLAKFAIKVDLLANKTHSKEDMIPL
jgi:hypothetical protein